MALNNKLLILLARTISDLFSPFYLPTVAFTALFAYSYLQLLPVAYKLAFVGIVFVFTAALPRFNIFLYQKINGLTHRQMGARENRYVPFVLSILSYAVLFYIMGRFHLPRFAVGVIVAALAVQVACFLLNPWIKLCIHATGSGGLIGALLAFAFIFHFDPTFWLCVAILLSGLVCTARLVLRQQRLSELGLGTLVGLLCGFFCVLLV
ncbi:MAG: hypothetical protein ACI353_05750 [Alloprevotella sp.]